MNKLLTDLINFLKSFIGLVVFFGISILYSYLIKSIPYLQNINKDLLLLIPEIITALILIIIYRKKIKRDFIDFDKNYKNYLTFGFKVWIIATIIMIISNNFLYHHIVNDIAHNQELNIMAINNFPLYSVIAMIILGPLVEEIVFRLSFKENIKNKILYYFLSVLIFAGVHVINGLTSPIQLLFFIPYGALAFAFSYILDKTNNIFTTVIIHSVHNTLAVILIIITSFIGV